VLLCGALPARAATDLEVVPGGSALELDAKHEKPLPQKTISGSPFAKAVILRNLGAAEVTKDPEHPGSA
jgi:hypothetical protein